MIQVSTRADCAYEETLDTIAVRDEENRPLPRSYLYVPGTAPERFDKAIASGADAVILDLEDAVPLAAKARARQNVVDFLSQHRADTGVELWVRINPGHLGEEDLSSLGTGYSLTGIVLAKAGLTDLERVADTQLNNSLLVSPLIETPEAVRRIDDLLRVPRVARVQLGEYDLCAAVGLDPGPDESETAWARNQIVFACAGAGSTPPVAPVSINIHDLDALQVSTERARRQGFFGRACIHPSQVALVHKVFTPSVRAIDEAQQMLERFEAGLAAGRGAIVDKSGRIIDEAVVRSARRTLSTSQQPTTDMYKHEKKMRHSQLGEIASAGQDSMMSSTYKGYRFPREIIAHCVWLYHRFPLSYREVEVLMRARGVDVSYETIRTWCAAFGPEYAAALRRRAPRPDDRWHLDEVSLKINGKRQYLWRAVDQHGNVLDILLQTNRDEKSATRFFASR
ncbi:citrate lyase beta subunit [Rhodococcus sp. OK302]|nr:citrate lyase beta subunit [Rhodococcus sp. OK302]